MPPAIQSIPTCMMLIPMEVMTTPVTTVGKSGIRRPMRGTSRVEITPAAMVAPKMPGNPSSGLPPMASMGMTAAKVTDMMTGRRIPAKRPIPRHCSRVTMPQQNRSALMR
ncbi:hypothetical protein D3C80_1658050 [compost metagenome]